MAANQQPAKRPAPEQAIKARRADVAAKVARVESAIHRVVRNGGTIRRAHIAALADVSRTFLYENDEARAAIDAALARTETRRSTKAHEQSAEQDMNWRERALNAEQALKTTRQRVTEQAQLISELLGQLRDPDGTWAREERAELRAQNERLRADNADLRRTNQDLERTLEAARSNVRRLQSKRVDELYPDGPGLSGRSARNRAEGVPDQ
jgi:chromosome segregation ATPase